MLKVYSTHNGAVLAWDYLTLLNHFRVIYSNRSEYAPGFDSKRAGEVYETVAGGYTVTVDGLHIKKA